jgi:hypothetical protein
MANHLSRINEPLYDKQETINCAHTPILIIYQM